MVPLDSKKTKCYFSSVNLKKKKHREKENFILRYTSCPGLNQVSMETMLAVSLQVSLICCSLSFISLSSLFLTK